MRFGYLHYSYAAVAAAPVVAWAAGAGLWLAIIWEILVILATWFWTFKGMKDKKPTAYTLESISASHYVERVRWSLQRLGAEFVEEEDVGILGVFSSGRQVPRLHSPADGSVIGNSPSILRFLWGRHCTEPRAAFLEPTTEALELEQELDKAAIHFRRQVYVDVFRFDAAAINKDLALKAWGANQAAIPAWQKLVLRLLLPVFCAFIKWALRLAPKYVDDIYAKVNAIFDAMDERLSDGRKFLLGGDEPSFCDITWASYAGLLLMAPEYSGGVMQGNSLLSLDQVPHIREKIEALRARPSGQLAMRLYKETRMADANSSTVVNAVQ